MYDRRRAFALLFSLVEIVARGSAREWNLQGTQREIDRILDGQWENGTVWKPQPNVDEQCKASIKSINILFVGSSHMREIVIAFTHLLGRPSSEENILRHSPATVDPCPDEPLSGIDKRAGCWLPGFVQWRSQARNLTVGYQFVSWVKMLPITNEKIRQRLSETFPTPDVVVLNTGVWGCQSPGPDDVGLGRPSELCSEGDRADFLEFLQRWREQYPEALNIFTPEKHFRSTMWDDGFVRQHTRNAGPTLVVDKSKLLGGLYDHLPAPANGLKFRGVIEHGYKGTIINTFSRILVQAICQIPQVVDVRDSAPVDDVRPEPNLDSQTHVHHVNGVHHLGRNGVSRALSGQGTQRSSLWHTNGLAADKLH
eukprot:1182152-Prorocentrum_minimum.AAC.2